MRVYLIGFMGSGKTHWGRQLSEKLKWPFFDLDEQVESHAGKTVEEIFKIDGEEQFRMLEKEVLHIITESHDSFVMACGGGSPCYFNNIEYMKQAGTVIWINTALEISGDKRRNIFLCVKETLNNALKHSGASQINIDFKLDDQLTITIADNGKGINMNQLRQFGNGLKNIAHRMETIGGKFTIEERNGTITTLQLPV